jgi:hypothetical protein
MLWHAVTPRRKGAGTPSLLHADLWRCSPGDPTRAIELDVTAPANTGLRYTVQPPIRNNALRTDFIAWLRAIHSQGDQ